MTAMQSPKASWSNIGSGIYMAIVSGSDLYVTCAARGEWAIVVDGKAIERRSTKREAMAAAESAIAASI